MNSIKNIIDSMFRKLNINVQNSMFKRLKSALQWSFLGLFFSKGSALVASVIVARLLGPAGNGELGVISTTLSLFATVAGMGLGLTSTKYIAENKNTDKLKASRIVGMTNIVGAISGFGFGFLLLFGSDWLCTSFLNAPHLSDSLKVASIIVAFSTYNGIQKGVLSGYEQFKKIAIIDGASGVLNFILYIAGALLYGLMGVVIAQAIVAIVTNVIFYFYIKKANIEHNIKPDYRNAFSEKKILYSFALPSMLGGIMVTPIMWFCQTIITGVEGGYTELGIYNAAIQWRQILHLIPSVLGNALLPILVSNKEDNKWLEKVNILLGWILVSIFASPVLLFSEYIATIYGSEYDPSKYAISACLIVFTSIIYSYKEGITRKLVQKSVVWFSVASNLVWGVAAITLHYLLRNQGSIGIAISYFLAYLLSTVIFLPIYIKKKYVKLSIILSDEIIVIWIMLATQFTLAFIQVNIFLRLFSTILICCIIFLNLKKIIKSR